MSSSTIIVLVIAVIVVLAVIAFIVQRRRRSLALRSHFGPEYERAVEDVGSRRRAEAELHDRQKRVAHFDIRPLSPSDRDRFIGAWRAVQADFVDEPKTALARADDLLTDVMRARGYPIDNFEQRSADLSVDHPSVVQNYRAGRDIAIRHRRGQATTEDLRQAMIHYRALFDELVGEVDQAERRRAS